MLYAWEIHPLSCYGIIITMSDVRIQSPGRCTGIYQHNFLLTFTSTIPFFRPVLHLPEQHCWIWSRCLELTVIAILWTSWTLFAFVLDFVMLHFVYYNFYCLMYTVLLRNFNNICRWTHRSIYICKGKKILKGLKSFLY